MTPVRSVFRSAVLFVTALSVVAAAQAQVTLKLATVAPRDSRWHEILADMGDAWSEASDGDVRLKIYAGTLGDEDDIMRRIRIGQLDAAAVTTAGLSTVDPTALVLSVPLLFETEEELDHVRELLAPRLEKVLEESGFIVLNWGEAGWVRFFTKEPVRTPEDLGRLKLFVWASGTQIDGYYKDAGFQPVPLALSDVLTGLQTRMVTAVPTTPLAALANQWFPATPHMSDLRWAPLVGATIVSKKGWRKVPEKHREKLIEIARNTGVTLREETRRLESEALDVLAERGVETVPLSESEHETWRELTRSFHPKIRTELIDAAIFDEAVRLRDAHRASSSTDGS